MNGLSIDHSQSIESVDNSINKLLACPRIITEFQLGVVS